jgi:hypothetical protein
MRPLSVATQVLPPAVVATLYGAFLKAVGGAPPYTWGLSSDEFPPGFALARGTGVVSGETRQAGDFNFLVDVRDSVGITAEGAVSISVSAPSPPRLRLRHRPRMICIARTESPVGAPVTAMQHFHQTVKTPMSPTHQPLGRIFRFRRLPNSRRPCLPER